MTPFGLKPGAPGVATLVGMCLLVTGSLGVASSPADSPELDDLYFCRWEGQALGHTVAGSCCFLFGEAGALRVEVLPGSSSEPGPRTTTGEALDHLLFQKGAGYTLVLGEGIQGTTNPWGERWNLLDAGLTPWIRTVARVTASGGVSDEDIGLLGGDADERRPLPRPRFLATGTEQTRSRVYRLELPELTREGAAAIPSGDLTTFRSSQIARSGGRGGDAEILQIRIPGPDQPLVFRSSRKPGQLLVTPPVKFSVDPPDREVFAPLWPLADLLRISGEEKIRELP